MTVQVVIAVRMHEGGTNTLAGNAASIAQSDAIQAKQQGQGQSRRRRQQKRDCP